MHLELSNASATVRIAPELGASLLAYELADGRQILRATPDAKDAFNTACYLLAPWCNRIDGGIRLPDRHWQAIAPTHPAHPLPIHGSASQQVWTVVQASDESATLSTICDWPKPFHYLGQVTYALDGSTLGISLSLTHLGDMPLPYGLGVHPWFTRTETTCLRAPSTHWQQTDHRQIPTGDEPAALSPDIDFNVMQSLPAGLIDTAFAGWSGTAQLKIAQDLSVRITTEPTLKHYQVYSTGSDADFVCFEPVTHPVNAHNMPGYPGLVLLSKNESTTLSVSIAVAP